MAATALVGCGDSGDDRLDARRDGTTAPTPPRAVPAVSAEASDRGVVLDGRNRGLRLWLRPSADQQFAPGLRATIQVMPTATTALRRRLARTAGTQLRCETDGRPSQGVVVRTTGPRDAVPVGHRIRTKAFLILPKGRSAPESVRSCRLVVAPERRGDTTMSYSPDPRTTVALYRFR